MTAIRFDLSAEDPASRCHTSLELLAVDGERYLALRELEVTERLALAVGVTLPARLEFLVVVDADDELRAQSFP